MKEQSKLTGIKLLTKAKLIMLTATAAPYLVHAEGEGTNEWNQVMDYISKWMPRLGGVVIFIGAIEFALAFKSEDAEGKTKGMRTIIAGAMVTGITAALGTLLKAS